MRLLALLLLAGVLAGADLTVSLRSEVLVAGETATLGEIAEVAGAEALAAPARALVVQGAVGLTACTVEVSQVRAALARSLPQATAEVTGTCRLARRPLRFDAEALAEAARHHLEKRLTGPVREVRLLRRPQGLTLGDDAAASATLEAEPLTADLWGEVPYRIRVLRGGRELGRALAVFTVRATRRVAVAVRDLPPGHRLDLADLRVEERELTSATGPEPPGLDLLVGRLTRRRIATDEAVPLTATRPRPLVGPGRPAVIVVGTPSFEITAAGEALSEAGAGERVRIRQGETGIVEGVVQADGRVRIGG